MKYKIELKAVPNYSARTFTIRAYCKGVMYAKYRTVRLNKEEFNSELMNTTNDWKQFLKTDNYYKVN